MAPGASEASYHRVMGALKSDTEVDALERSQAELREPMGQYINRRVSDWRIITGKARAIEHAALIEGIENQYGVDRYRMLALWGMESAFGDVATNRSSPHSPGASLADAPIGSRSSSMHSSSSNADGRKKKHDRLAGRRHGTHAVDAIEGALQHGLRVEHKAGGGPCWLDAMLGDCCTDVRLDLGRVAGDRALRASWMVGLLS